MNQLVSQFMATSPWEALAAALGLAYLLLAVKRSLWCWLCAFVSTSIYLMLFADAKLYMQSALQLFYLVMAVYGFMEWRRGRTESGEVVIRSWPLRSHLIAAAAIALATVLNGWLLGRETDAVAPYLDSFVTWSSVVTTWMVAKRLIENWLYWVVIDGLAAYLYFSQQMLVTALLFLLYVGIVIHGYVQWRRHQTVQDVGIAVTEAGT
jgi:nicotinamide mononucleotide transporter